MPGFLYFVPGLQGTPAKSEWAKLGIAHAFTRSPQFAGVQNILGGRSGVILYDDERVEVGRGAFHADQQTWQQIPGTETFVGMYTRPSPGDLQRVDMLAGSPLVLADERSWLIPLARSWNDVENGPTWTNELPQLVRLDEKGEWTFGQTLPRYQLLWDIGQEYFDFCFGGKPAEELPRMKDLGLFSSAAQVLGGNYLVGPAECSLLGLLTSQHAIEILNALIQRQTLEELLQKKTEARASAAGSPAPPSSPSSAGPADVDREATPPAT